MECDSDWNKKPLKEACYSLLTIAIGFLSCSVIVVLTYFTYQTAAGNRTYCTLWTDIPGRLAIFIIFYYAAGICGSLPIPERIRINSLPQPFILYKLDSWRCLFRNLCLLLPFNCQIHGIFGSARNGSEMSPLRTGSDVRSHECSPNSGERSDNVPIVNTDPPKGHVFRSKKVARNRDREMANCSKTSMSFDSPIGGHIVPMAKGSSSKSRYFPDSSISTTESSDKYKPGTARSEFLYDVSETLNDRAKAVAEIRSEVDTPPRTPEVELPMPNYPRFPWSFLKHRGGLPQEARALHKRHLMAERRELDKRNKKQRMAETVQLSREKGSENEWTTDSDDFNPIANRPPCLPQIHTRSKVCFRGRTKSTPGNIRKLGKIKAQSDRRTVSRSVPHEARSSATTKIIPKSEGNFDKIDKEDFEDKCCENSLDLKSKVDHIKQILKRFGPTFQTGEASTSRQNIDVFYNKTLDKTNDNDESDGILPISAETKSSTEPKQ